MRRRGLWVVRRCEVLVMVVVIAMMSVAIDSGSEAVVGRWT